MNSNEFGKYLRQKRKAAGYTLEGLSQKIGTSKSHLSNIENGHRGVPSPELLQKLVVPLDVSYEELMIIAGYWGESELVDIEDLLDELEQKKIEVLFKENRYESYTNSDGSISTRLVNRKEIINRFFDIDYILKKRDKAYINGHELSEAERQTIITLLNTVFPQYQEPPSTPNE